MDNHILSKTIALIDEQRRKQGFLSIAQMLERYSKNIILDPFSTLISEGVEMGEGNVIYPNIIIESRNGGNIVLGDKNILYPGTLFLADHGGIRIGSENEFGDGGLRLKSNMEGTSIVIGDSGRYTNNAAIVGPCSLGSGSQVLGPITAQNCHLEAGESYKHDDPDLRAGVLKGFGQARNLTVKQGEVINGKGIFEQANVERQIVYHPKKK
jgi:NDP-sugar pyrophosphorylase family protein